MAFRDAGGGSLVALGRYVTGGVGSGDGLGSQGAVTLSSDERFLFAVNAGSNTVTGFEVQPDGSLRALGQISSGGVRPVSVTAQEGIGFVLNDTSRNLTGFAYSAAGVKATVAGRPLNADAAGPAQVKLTPDARAVVVTEKVSNSLDVFRVSGHGRG